MIETARHSHSILCTTPSAIKCVFLKLNEVLAQLHEKKTKAEDKSALQKRADYLQRILRTFSKSVAIFDEVDVILNPLKSELTFSFEKSRIGDAHKHRYLIPEFLVHGVFGIFDETQGYHIGSDIRDFFATMDQRYKKAIRNQEFIDANFYFEELPDDVSKRHSIQWWVSRLLVCYLQHHCLLNDDDDPDNIADKILGADETAVPSSLPEHVCICAKWCQNLLPHVISKNHRYHYGLLSEVDGLESERMLKAVPFLGKDFPSPDSEFSNLDVTFGFTALSYMKQALRKEDVNLILLHLKKQLCDPKYRIQILQIWAQWTSEIDKKYCCLELVDVKDALANLHNELKEHKAVKRYYLQRIVLPKSAVYSQKSLSVGAPDFCNMFCRVIGFSGTPSKDLYPVRWKYNQALKQILKPNELMPTFNQKHMSKIMHALTSSENVMSIAYIDDAAEGMNKFSQDWTVTELLATIAQSAAPRVSSLVDCGALITGYSNLEVANFFMNEVKEDGFCSTFSACIFWDESDTPLALERGNSSAVPLSACSSPVERWFVYFDQVHTTGIDIKLPSEAIAVVTIGRDTVLRDYVQACWRMRQFGDGQRIKVLLVPEIRRLVTKYTADNLEPGFTPRARPGRQIDTFVSEEQDIKVENHGGLIADDIYKYLSHRQQQVESFQRNELFNQELRVWRRRRMQLMIWSDPINLVDECFFQTHDEKGSCCSLQVPNDHELTRKETEEKETLESLQRELIQQANRRLDSSCLDAQSVHQRQREQQKESARQIENDEQIDAPVVRWKLSHLISLNNQFFHCLSTQYSDVVGFYPDFIYASATFAAALHSPQHKYVLPNVEAIVEVKPKVSSEGNPRAVGDHLSACIIFITLREADTLCCLLRKTTDADLQQRVSLFVIDSNGYCSDTVSRREANSSCPDGHLYPILTCSSSEELDRYIDQPSRLYQSLAFALLFNCNMQYDVLQTTCIMHGLHLWHLRNPSQSVRDSVHSSFSKLAQIRRCDNDFKYSPSLMVATHEDIFSEDTFQGRWCPAIKLMLRVMRQVCAFSSSVSQGTAQIGVVDLQHEVTQAMSSMKVGENARHDMHNAVSCTNWVLS